MRGLLELPTSSLLTITYIVKIIFSYTKLYFLWILIHYFSSKFYGYYCTPDTIYGLFRSSFMVITPQCQVLDWVQRRSREILCNMWVMIGLWCSTELLKMLSPKPINVQKL